MQLPILTYHASKHRLLREVICPGTVFVDGYDDLATILWDLYNKLVPFIRIFITPHPYSSSTWRPKTERNLWWWEMVPVGRPACSLYSPKTVSLWCVQYYILYLQPNVSLAPPLLFSSALHAHLNARTQQRHQPRCVEAAQTVPTVPPTVCSADVRCSVERLPFG